jgi:hypothetical protein
MNFADPYLLPLLHTPMHFHQENKVYVPEYQLFKHRRFWVRFHEDYANGNLDADVIVTQPVFLPGPPALPIARSVLLSVPLPRPTLLDITSDRDPTPITNQYITPCGVFPDVPSAREHFRKMIVKPTQWCDA